VGAEEGWVGGGLLGGVMHEGVSVSDSIEGYV